MSHIPPIILTSLNRNDKNAFMFQYEDNLEKEAAKKKWRADQV